MVAPTAAAASLVMPADEADDAMLETRETASSWLLTETEGGRGGQRWLVVPCLRSHALFCMYEEPLTCPLSESWSGEEVTELRTLACCASAVLSVASCISTTSAA